MSFKCGKTTYNTVGYVSVKTIKPPDYGSLSGDAFLSLFRAGLASSTSADSAAVPAAFVRLIFLILELVQSFQGLKTQNSERSQ